MGVFKFLRIAIAMSGFVLLLAVAHAYNTSQNDAFFDSGAQSKFVDGSGNRSRTMYDRPSVMDTVGEFFAGLTGKEEEPNSGLGALRKRQQIEQALQSGGDERAIMAEHDFWVGFANKLGFLGP